VDADPEGSRAGGSRVPSICHRHRRRALIVRFVFDGGEVDNPDPPDGAAGLSITFRPSRFAALCGGKTYDREKLDETFPRRNSAATVFVFTTSHHPRRAGARQQRSASISSSPEEANAKEVRFSIHPLLRQLRWRPTRPRPALADLPILLASTAHLIFGGR